MQLTAVGPRLSVSTRIAMVQTAAVGRLELHEPMESLKSVIKENRGANHLPEMMCYGLLEYFDLPVIDKMIAPRKVA